MILSLGACRIYPPSVRICNAGGFTRRAEQPVPWQAPSCGGRGLAISSYRLSQAPCGLAVSPIPQLDALVGAGSAGRSPATRAPERRQLLRCGARGVHVPLEASKDVSEPDEILVRGPQLHRQAA
jgi:hypothetical protein